MAAPSEFVFTARASSAGLYLGQESLDGREVPYPRVAYVPPAGLARYPVEVSLESAWAWADGVYLFLGQAVYRQDVFVTGLRRLLQGPEHQQARCLWIANPREPMSRWRTWAIGTTGGGRVAPVNRPALFRFQNYGLVVAKGCTLETSYEEPALTLGLGEDPTGAWLTAGDGARELRIVSGAGRIPFTGPTSGCLHFPLALPMAAAEGAPTDLLDVGMRTYQPDPMLPGLLRSRYYPLFQPGAAGTGPILAEAVLDPLDPLAPDRSHLALTTEQPPIPSWLRSALGHGVSLAPRQGARLRFTERPATHVPGSGSALTLAPDGDFSLRVPDHRGRGVPGLLCGTFGAEYVRLEQETLVRFLPGQPAYAPGSASQAPEANGLTSLATTSWVSIGAPAPLYYFNQPDRAILHRRAQGDAPFLDYFPVVGGVLPPLDADGTPVFPLLPYAGVRGQDLAACRELEAQVIGPLRRGVIYREGRTDPTSYARHAVAPAEPCRDNPPALAATPQGLVAGFASAAPGEQEWLCLRLARMGAEQLAFQSITEPLRSALLTNQQFLVISDPSAARRWLADYTSLTVAGWRFLLDPEKWREHGTVLILKNHVGAFADLAKNPTSWALPNAFNASPSRTGRRLEDIMTAARQRLRPSDGSEPDEDFRSFVETVLDDARWNGILFLNAFVPLEGLPAELQGLAAGMDPAGFYAHHLGIDQTPVKDLSLAMHDSSLFGLIHYEKGLAPATRSDYDFQVLSLKVRLRNSLVAGFSSRIAVTLNRLFSAPARQEDSETGNSLILEGVYQRHGDGFAYVFSSRKTGLFTLEGSILNRVQVDKAQFVTQTERDGSDRIRALFSFWGWLRFEALEWQTNGEAQPFDVFSYEHLEFAGLGLEMSFPPASPASRRFAFDPSGIRFDPNRSPPRDTALARRFPLTLRSLAWSDGGRRIGDLGYMPVSIPVQVQSLGVPWYALVFDLDLGSVGALAAKAGLTAGLAVAWSPGSSGTAAFVGLKLPGSTGTANQIGLQGVLQLSMYSVELVYNLAEDGEGAFLLKLNGMDLKFLSKTLPPGGYFDFYLFGDPQGTAGSLGWYGAYKRDKDEKKDADQNLPSI